MKLVWIVDDDEEMNRAIGLMLQVLDCDVVAFLGARPAVQTLLNGNTPDLLLLDINMPEVSGLDMLEFLRRRKEWKDLPVIMLSSEAAESVIDKSMEMGADSYLMKPITLEELEKTMANVIQKRVSVK
jgi:DNA-binding response OmpR family regulator